MKEISLRNQWTRSEDGWIAGVCQGIGEKLDVNPMVLRLFWMGSVLFFGAGLFMYFICAFCLPLEGHEAKAMEPKFLGVCSRVARKLDLDIGLVRVITVVVGIGSMGTTLLAYVLVHFLVPEPSL